MAVLCAKDCVGFVWLRECSDFGLIDGRLERLQGHIREYFQIWDCQ